MAENIRTKSPEDELQFQILQLLFSSRMKNPRTGGASGKELLNDLKLDSIDKLRDALVILTDKKFVVAGNRNFQITTQGVDFLHDIPPSSNRPAPPGSSSPPWSPGDPPGDWPPRNGPDDPSRVPRRNSPSGDSGAIALPLPPANNGL